MELLSSESMSSISVLIHTLNLQIGDRLEPQYTWLLCSTSLCLLYILICNSSLDPQIHSVPYHTMCDLAEFCLCLCLLYLFYFIPQTTLIWTAATLRQLCCNHRLRRACHTDADIPLTSIISPGIKSELFKVSRLCHLLSTYTPTCCHQVSK